MNLTEPKSPTSGILSLSARTELSYSNTPPVVIEMVETKQIPSTVAAIREAKREVLAQEDEDTQKYMEHHYLGGE